MACIAQSARQGKLEGYADLCDEEMYLCHTCLLKKRYFWSDPMGWLERRRRWSRYLALGLCTSCFASSCPPRQEPAPGVCQDFLTKCRPLVEHNVASAFMRASVAGKS